MGNPSGAVAKASQNAATQPPTVIIQATGGGYSETYPILVNATVAPACPSGYTSIFSASGNGPIANPIINAGGTRYSLGPYSDSSGWTFNAFYLDQPPAYAGKTMGVALVNGYVSYANYNWAARLCSK